MVVAVFSLSSCEDFGDPPPRIIPGVSIDGIQLAFTREQVERRAGVPARIGWADGPYKGWRVYGYDQVRFRWPCFAVYFLEVSGMEYGPVDLVTAGPGYDGRTREGLGIGSSRGVVHRNLGIPVNIVLYDSLNGGWDDYYCFLKTNMIFRYNLDTVQFITLGPLVPEPNTPRCD